MNIHKIFFLKWQINITQKKKNLKNTYKFHENA